MESSQTAKRLDVGLGRGNLPVMNAKTVVVNDYGTSSVLFGFAMMASAPTNIDPARKDIEDWHQRVKSQAHLGP
jgi:hypothetical protein